MCVLIRKSELLGDPVVFFIMNDLVRILGSDRRGYFKAADEVKSLHTKT